MPEKEAKSDNSAPRKKPATLREVPASIKSLRKHTRDHGLPRDLDGFEKELFHENDRTAIILCAALLEEALTYRLMTHFTFEPTEEEANAIFRFEGPLGTFSSKCEISCLFDIIEEDTYTQLDIIREMRNACAHSKHTLKLSDNILANVAKRLSRPLGFTNQPSEEADYRATFLIEVLFPYYSIMNGRAAAGSEIREALLRRRPASEPSPDK